MFLACIEVPPNKKYICLFLDWELILNMKLPIVYEAGKQPVLFYDVYDKESN